MRVPNAPQVSPEGARLAGPGYWFTPLPTYLLDAVFNPDSPVNAPAAMLWAHIHRHYAWRERVFPSYARLAEETNQSESAVKRQLNALKAAGALTWGATYGRRGRSSNTYALAALEPFRFDRDTGTAVEVKNDPHTPVQVKSEPPVQVGSDPHPQVKNDLGVKSSSYLESTEDSLSSPAPAVPPAGGSDRERETPAAPDNHTSGSSEPGSEPLTVPQRLVRAAGLLQPAEEQQFIAWVAATHKPRGAGWWRAVAASGDLPDLVAAWRTQHTPAATPTSSSLPPWCGDLDCSEIDRMREIERPDGHRVVTRCPACHPATAA